MKVFRKHHEVDFDSLSLRAQLLIRYACEMFGDHHQFVVKYDGGLDNNVTGLIVKTDENLQLGDLEFQDNGIIDCLDYRRINENETLRKVIDINNPKESA